MRLPQLQLGQLLLELLVPLFSFELFVRKISACHPTFRKVINWYIRLNYEEFAIIIIALFRSGIPTFYDNRYTYVSTALLRTITARGFHERLATGNTYNRRSTVANRTTTWWRFGISVNKGSVDGIFWLNLFGVLPVSKRINALIEEKLRTLNFISK